MPTEIKDKSSNNRKELNSSIKIFEKLLSKIDTSKLKSAKAQLKNI